MTDVIINSHRNIIFFIIIRIFLSQNSYSNLVFKPSPYTSRGTLIEIDIYLLELLLGYPRLLRSGGIVVMLQYILHHKRKCFYHYGFLKNLYFSIYYRWQINTYRHIYKRAN